MALSNDCVDRMIAEAVGAVRDDGAEAIVLGCTGTRENLPREIRRAVREAVRAPVPIIDPVEAAFAFASMCVATGLRHSRVAYPEPRGQRTEYRFASA